MLKSIILLVSSFAWARTEAQTVGFIGDSISTGGGSHPALAYDLEQLEKVFADSSLIAPDAAYSEALAGWGLGAEPAQPPRRLEIVPREFAHPLSWVYEKALHLISHRYLDAEEYSWSYLWARKRNIAPDQILIAARDGERSAHGVRQVDRLLDAHEGRALQHLFVFFTGNDLCAADISLATPAPEFLKGIEQAVRYYVRNAKPGEGPHYIWLVDPLGILQIVTAPEILNHKVKASGQELSCRDLQAGRFTPQFTPWQAAMTPAQIFMNAFGQGPRNYCPSLFAVHQGSSEVQMRIGATLKSYREGIAQLHETLQVLPTQFRVRHLKSAASLIFSGDEMANDCFHLSLKGHHKVATALDAEIRELTLPEP